MGVLTTEVSGHFSPYPCSLRIGLVVPSIMNWANGIHLYLASLAEQLCEAGHDVTLITADLGHQGGPGGPPIELNSRVMVKLFHVRSKFDRRIYRSTEMTNWLIANARNFDVADIQGVWSFIAVDAAETFYRFGVPYLITPHGQTTKVDWDKHPIAKRIFYKVRLRRTWQRACAIRFYSRDELRDSLPRDETRAVILPGAVVPRPVDVTGEAVQSFRTNNGIPSGYHVILFLGRITEQKGVVQIVDAFQHLYVRRRDAILVLIGPLDGEYGRTVARKVTQASCRQAIRMLEPIYDDSKWAALASASLFVTLSSNEGLPRAVLEALSHGVPVVATTHSNLPEIETYQAGRLVNRDASQVAQVFDELLGDAGTLAHMSINARRLIEERFSPGVVVGRTLEMYQRVAQLRTP